MFSIAIVLELSGFPQFSRGSGNYIIFSYINLIQPAGARFWVLDRRFPKVVLILTLGSAGALGREPGEAAFFVPAVKVTAVDTTGAGDTFAGYVAAALDAGERLEPAMRRAAKASAISVTREGAAPSIPTLAEVEAVDA